MIKIKRNATILKPFSQTFKTTIPFLRNVYENKHFCFYLCLKEEKIGMEVKIKNENFITGLLCEIR